MGYLDQYAERTWVFSRLAKGVAYALLLSIVGYSVYWLFFRNWQEERQVSQFLSQLQGAGYAQAYEHWGCTVAEPCKFYPYDDFLEDWGPDSPLGSVTSYSLGRSYTQEGGVIIELKINGEKQQNLWVQKDTGAIGFFPY